MPAGRSSPFSAFRAEAAFSSAPTPIEEPAPIHRTAFLANSFLFPTPRGACIPTPPGALRSSARSLESQGVGPPLFGPPGVIPSARVDAVFEVRVGHGAGIKCQMVVGGGPVEGRWGGGKGGIAAYTATMRASGGAAQLARRGAPNSRGEGAWAWSGRRRKACKWRFKARGGSAGEGGNRGGCGAFPPLSRPTPPPRAWPRCCNMSRPSYSSRDTSPSRR